MNITEVAENEEIPQGVSVNRGPTINTFYFTHYYSRDGKNCLYRIIVNCPRGEQPWFDTHTAYDIENAMKGTKP